jgi:uncharacterized protein YjbI with pentapeptide repeats
MSDDQPQPPDGYKSWDLYWQGQNMPWRSQPEIDKDRQKVLAARRAITPNIKQGIYPFNGIEPTLSRADIEWLLATHEEGRGPVDWDDVTQRNRLGLDLRGANLSGLDLHGLPLARLRGGLTGPDFFRATESERVKASVEMKRTILTFSHMEGAALTCGHLEGAKLDDVRLEGADLYGLHLEDDNPADLRRAVFDADTLLARMTLATKDHPIGPSCLSVRWGGASLTAIDWSTVNILEDEVEAQKPLMQERKMKSSETVLRDYDRAVQTYRQLTIALRGQGLHEPADRFAYRAQLLQRTLLYLQNKQGQHKTSEWLINWGLYLLTGYGYRLRHIFMTYGLCLLVFTVIFWLLGVHSFPHEAGLRALWDSFLVSLSAIHGRTTFEQLGAWTTPAWFAAVESAFGIIVEGAFVAMLVQRFFSR